MKKKYKALTGSPITDEDANVFGSFLEREFSSGGITPNAVVKKAEDPKSPIHNLFEWDDRLAAEGYRLQQARLYLRSIVVWTDDGDEIRAFHHVKIDTMGSEYVPLSRALNTQNLWEQVIEQALKEAQSWAKRYERYEQLKPIREAIHHTYKTYVKRRPHEKEDRAIQRN